LPYFLEIAVYLKIRQYGNLSAKNEGFVVLRWKLWKNEK
jgi:hypothetical protein